MIRPVILMLVVLLAACESRRPKDTYRASFANDLTIEEARDTITLAGNKEGWVIDHGDTGRSIGTLHRDDRTAVVNIVYGTQIFSVFYRDSSNLEYQDGLIDPDYNLWVTALVRSIRLASAGYPEVSIRRIERACLGTASKAFEGVRSQSTGSSFERGLASFIAHKLAYETCMREKLRAAQHNQLLPLWFWSNKPS